MNTALLDQFCNLVRPNKGQHDHQTCPFQLKLPERLTKSFL